MAWWFPGWLPQPLAGGRCGIRSVTPPATPMVYGAGAPNPLEAMSAYGVPLVRLPTGQIVLQTQVGEGGEGIHMPPDLPGMPPIPRPPEGLLTGGPQGGGLLQPIIPVSAFDSSNQVTRMQAQQRSGGGPMA